MLEDIESGQIDAVMCTALSRISRSTRDLLDMVADLNKRKVDFICLKEQFDTTTAQGTCFMTIMAALNQFEREQTSERTRSNMYERTKRGLWQGGQVLGYNLDPNKRGNLIPNEEEARTVNFLFDAYLENGSVKKVAKLANLGGYVGKTYTTIKGKTRVGQRFGYSAVRKVLTNLAYVGVREWSKGNKDAKKSDPDEDVKYATFPTVWKPIIDREKFDKVQKLLAVNHQHRNNGAKPTKHSYLFNGELLVCHKCGSRMEGRSGHGKSGKVYYYYYCMNDVCRHKVTEPEIEQAVAQMVEIIATKPVMLGKVTEIMNVHLRGQAPKLKESNRAYTEEIANINAAAKDIMGNLSNIQSGKVFVEEKLAELEASVVNLTLLYIWRFLS